MSGMRSANDILQWNTLPYFQASAFLSTKAQDWVDLFSWNWARKSSGSGISKKFIVKNEMKPFEIKTKRDVPSIMMKHVNRSMASFW